MMVTATQNTNPSTSLINALNAANSSLATNQAPTDSASSLQNRFMTLLVTQLKNQDPLNPMDNAQMTSQLAQLSTVTGVNQLNSTLQAMNNSMSSGAATNMIGHGVLVAGSAINLTRAGGVYGVNLSQPADSLKITIKDASGAVVRTINLGAQPAGVQPFVWDGKTDAGATAANGTYSFSVQALAGGNSFPSTSLAYGLVNAVTPGAQGKATTLDVGQLGSFDMSSIAMVM